MLELLHLVFFFACGFPAPMDELASWTPWRLIGGRLLGLGRSGRFLRAQHNNPCAADKQQHEKSDPEYPIRFHQRPAPAGCSTRRTISRASAAASACSPCSAVTRSFSMTTLAACTCACALLRASATALARACIAAWRFASCARKTAALASRRLCSYSAVRASAAAISALDFSIAPSVLVCRSSSTRCNGL